MNKPPIETGSVVISTAGRDQGRTFVVVESVDDAYVLIADGSTHKMEKPKKKKRKHLKLSPVLLPDAAARLAEGHVENHEVRKWLSDKEE